MNIPYYCHPCGENLAEGQSECPFCMNAATPADQPIFADYSSIEEAAIALAAAAQRAKTPKAVEGEAPQSGPAQQGNAQRKSA